MRSGRLLAEAPPLDLMKAHSLPTLEDVFLKLCERDQVDDEIDPSQLSISRNNANLGAEEEQRAPRVGSLVWTD